jgi:anti-anti-sigma factor
MPNDWSEEIRIIELADEPQLSEDLANAIDRAETADSAQGGTPAGNIKHTVLNFAGVRYMSSSHLAQLIRLRNLLAGRQKVLLLCAVPDNVWSIFLISGLDRVFRFAPDPLTALATIQLESTPRHEQDPR